MSKLLIFVGHLPATKRGESVRRAFTDILARHPYTAARFANDATPSTVRFLIAESVLCLFETTRSKDEGSLVELGYAQGRGRHCVVVHGPRGRRLDGFAGDLRLEYASLRELRESLERSFTEWLGEAIHRYTLEKRLVANLDSRLMAPLATSLLQGDLEDEFTVASDHGFSEEQVEATLGVLTSFGLVRELATGWTLTDLGRAHLPRLVAPMRRPREVPAGGP